MVVLFRPSFPSLLSLSPNSSTHHSGLTFFLDTTKRQRHTELRRNSSSNRDLGWCLTMTLVPRLHLEFHSVTPAQRAGLHGLTKPQMHGHRRIPPEAPTAQPPTTSLQIPSPHNHKLTAESEGNWGGEREGWDRRKKSGGNKKNGKQVQHMNEYLFLSYICNSHIQSLSFFAPFTHPPLPRPRRPSELQRAAPSSPSKQPNTSAIC